MKRDRRLLLVSSRVVGVAIVSLLSSSCFYVWQEPIRYGTDQPVEGQSQQQEPRTLDELKEQKAQGQQAEERSQPLPPAEDPTPPPPPRETNVRIPVARPVPGREGFVFSPYNNKLIDVKGFPSGKKVRDPHFPASDNKFFLVP